MDSTTVALIGIGCSLGISLLTTFIFLVLYTRIKLKDDTNIRRRVIAIEKLEVKAPLIVSQPVEEIVEPVQEQIMLPPPQPPVVYPTPVFQPSSRLLAVETPSQPPPLPQPLPPSPPREPEVIVHEIIHRYEPPAPQPPPPSPPPQPRAVRRQSWGGQQETDDWVLVKRITRGKKTAKYDSSDDSSDEEGETRVKRRQKRRLDRYDLATNIMPLGIQAQPQMIGGVMMAQPTAVMAPVVAQPMMTAAQPTYMPFVTMPR